MSIVLSTFRGIRLVTASCAEFVLLTPLRRDLEDQCRRQDLWNEAMKQAMKTMVQRQDDVLMPQEAIAMVQTKVNELSNTQDRIIKWLCKLSDILRGLPKLSRR